MCLVCLYPNLVLKWNRRYAISLWKWWVFHKENLRGYKDTSNTQFLPWIERYLGNGYHQLQHFHHLVGVISKLISTTSTISTISILQLGHCWSHFHHFHCFHYNKFGGVPEVIFTIFTISTILPSVWGSTVNSFPFVPPFPPYGWGHLWRDLHHFETSTMGLRAISEMISSISTLRMGAIYEEISTTSTFHHEVEDIFE